jgi:hypothetical protein
MFQQRRTKRVAVALALCALLFAGAAPALALQSAYFHSYTMNPDVVLFGAPGNWVVFGFQLPPNGVFATGYQDLLTSAGGTSFMSICSRFRPAVGRRSRRPPRCPCST